MAKAPTDSSHPREPADESELGSQSDIETRLHAAEALLHKTLEAVTDAVVIVDPELRPIYLNCAFAKLMGRTRKELLGRELKLDEFIAPEDLSRIHEQAQKRLQGTAQEKRAVYRFVGPNGTVRSVEASSAPFLRGDRVGGIVSVLRDVTDLQRQSLHLERAQAVAKVGSWELDFSTNTLKWSEQTHRLLGYTPGEVDPSLELFLNRIHPQDRPRMEAEMERSVGGVKETALDYRLLLPDGQVRHVHSTATATYSDEGRALHVLGVIHDVTERVLLQERQAQAEKLEAFGSLAAAVAHEFNNLIAKIQCSLAPPAVTARPGGEDNRAAMHYCEQAANLVRQLMQFSRKASPQKAAALINPIVSGAVELVKGPLGETVALEVALAETDAWIQGDARLLEQAFANLLLNARDAVVARAAVEPDEGYCPTVKVSVGVGSSEAQPLQVVVEDNGVGMTAALRGSIFEPFFTTKPPNQGIGLGLSVAYGVVYEHGGHIRVWSEPGRGSRFTVQLPMRPEPAPPQARTRQVSPKRQRALRVLVVDDEPILRHLASRVLENAGYQVEQASDGRQAIRKIDLGGVDVVLLDLNMPGINGYGVLAHVREHHPNLPVIVVSGYVDEAAIAALGARDVIWKPYGPEQLLEAVEEALESE